MKPDRAEAGKRREKGEGGEAGISGRTGQGKGRKEAKRKGVKRRSEKEGNQGRVRYRKAGEAGSVQKGRKRAE